MTISTTTSTPYDGVRRATVLSTGLTVNGATPNNLDSAVLVDVSALMPPAPRVKVDRIDADVGYGVVELFWDAAEPVRFAVLSGSKAVLDYTSIGGLVPPPEATGDILISTLGFDLNSTYTVKLDLTKKAAARSLS